MLTDLYDVMVTLGGEETLAAITGFTARHVLIWRNRGWFPAVTYRQIRANLLMKGLDVAVQIFGPPATIEGRSKILENKNLFVMRTPQSVAF